MIPDNLHLIGCSIPNHAEDATGTTPAPVFCDDEGATWILFDDNGNPKLASYPPKPGDEAWDQLAQHANARFVQAETPPQGDPASRPEALAACITHIASPHDAARLAGAVGGPVCGHLAALATQPGRVAATLAQLELTASPSVSSAAMATFATGNFSPPTTLGVSTPVPAVHTVLVAAQCLFDDTRARAKNGAAS
jgi:hypothetical protein